MSRLSHDKQHQLYGFIRIGKADTYNKLRSLANALLVPAPEQTVFGGAISEDEKSIGKKYDEMVDRLLSFIRRSFDKEDLKVLQKVTRSNVSVNITKLYAIIRQLNEIKNAMTREESKREALI